MNKFLSSYKESKKIFLGDTDSYTVIQNGYTEEELIFKIKMAVLLYDAVFIPAAYMWQSEQMKGVMYKIQPLILTENVLPIIRKSKETRDVKDYFEKRQNETKNLKYMDVFQIPSLATEIADSDDREDMLFLNKMNCCLHLEEKSVKEEFINLWQNDLLNNGDINAIFMILYRSNITTECYKIIINELKNNVDYENFSRSTLIDYILKLDISENIKLMLQERISWLYLMANARASQSDFYLSKSNNNLVYRANLDVYVKLLENFGISKNMIRLLSLENLLRIKYSAEYLNFIKNYNRLVENVYYEQKDIIEKTGRRINKMICQENIKRITWNKLSGVCGISATIFIGLLVNYFSGSDVNNVVAAVSGGVAASTAILKTIASINESMLDTSFYDFKEFIIKEEYKKRMQKNINGVLL